VLPLASGRAAYERMAAGEQFGKIVLENSGRSVRAEQNCS
jgi:hypothetical protein